MRITLHSWWKGKRKTLGLEVAVIFALALGFIAMVIVIIMGYIFNWNWTGLNSYTSPPLPRDSDFQRGKTLWDWMQLLIIPIVFAIGGFWLNRIQKEREQMAIDERAKREKKEADERATIEREAEEKRAQTEREIAADNQREAALQAYIDKMSELILEKTLRESTEDDEVRNIARVRTLTVIPRLDVGRKGTVIKFLHDSGLIEKGKYIIDLSGVDLRKAELGRANLSKANLSGANLRGAQLYGVNLQEAFLDGAYLDKANLRVADLDRVDLRGASLHGANLWRAKLPGADLSGAHLSGAHLSETNLLGANVTQEQLNKAKSIRGATMPDGSVHP